MAPDQAPQAGLKEPRAMQQEDAATADTSRNFKAGDGDVAEIPAPLLSTSKPPKKSGQKSCKIIRITTVEEEPEVCRTVLKFGYDLANRRS